MAPITVAITGFTGRLAILITQALLNKYPDVKIHGIARSVEKVPSHLRESDNVTIFSAASDDSSAIRKAIRGANIVICGYLGDASLMLDGQKFLVDASIAEGVPRYLASEWSFDYRGLKLGDHPDKDYMLKFNSYLEEQEAAGKIKGVHVLSAAFTEVILNPKLGWLDTKNDVFKFYGTGEEPLEMTTMDDIAAYTAAIAADPEAVGWYNVLGDRKSIKDLAQLYKQVYGVEPTLQRSGSLDDLAAAMRDVYKKDPEDKWAWVGMHYQYYMADGSTYLGRLDNDKFPQIKPMSTKAFLEKHSREEIASSY